jgi:hypothetical protein
MSKAENVGDEVADAIAEIVTLPVKVVTRLFDKLLGF